MVRPTPRVREVALAVLASALSWDRAQGQEVSPMPSPEVRDAYIAWEEGRYPDALEGYLAVLRGPDAEERVDEIARLTGELHPVRQIDDDGRNVQISPDGRYVRWVRGTGTDAVTRVARLADLATADPAAGAATPGGRRGPASRTGLSRGPD